MNTALRIIALGLALGLLIPSVVLSAANSPQDLLAPVFVTRPEQLSFSHCDTARFTFEAVSAVTGRPSPYVRYRIVSGPGTIDSMTGEWMMLPDTSAPAVGSYSLEIGASEFFLETSGPQNLKIQGYAWSYLPFVRFTNRPANGRYQTFDGQTVRIDYTLDAVPSCDSSWLYISDEPTNFHGTVDLNQTISGGSLLITPDSLDSGQSFVFYLFVANRFQTGRFSFIVHVYSDQTFSVRIQSVKNQLQGTFCSVPVTIDSRSYDASLGGFDLLIAFDNEYLSLQTASDSISSLYVDCHWEYFAYRQGPYNGCFGRCPSGIVRVSGIADISNGDIHPTCTIASLPKASLELFRLNFLVSNARPLECQRTPVSFYWIDCADNLLYDATTKKSFGFRSVSVRDSLTDSTDQVLEPTLGPPGYAGPIACVDSIPPYVWDMSINFHDGLVNVICADSIEAHPCFSGSFDDPPYYSEMLSAYIRFSNYFMYGVPALGYDTAYVKKCFDVNADGVALTVADLMYLAQMYTGNAQPYPKGIVTHMSSNKAHAVGPTGSLHVLWIETPDTLGAAYFEFEGDVNVNSWSNRHYLATFFDGTITHVLVEPKITETPAPFPDSYLLDVWNKSDTFGIWPRLLAAQAATLDGRRVECIIDGPTDVNDYGRLLPIQFALRQNYPNPFNAGTVIDFDLPTSADVSLDIFNILGQTIWSSSSHYAAGSHRIEWLGNMSAGGTASSGVYYYRLTAGSCVATKKMVLLK